jgi:amino acid efflux transporter
VALSLSARLDLYPTDHGGDNGGDNNVSVIVDFTVKDAMVGTYTLGLWEGAALYVGAVLGTGMLVLPAVAAETAGPASVLAWIALVMISFPLALTYAALSRDRPDSAGFAGAIERAFGPEWGAVAGWLFLAQLPTGSVIAALIAGEYGASLIGGGRVAAFALGGGLVCLAYLLNVAGLRVSTRAQILSLAAITMGMTVIVGRALGHLDTAAFLPVAPHGTAAIGLAAVQLFWAFVGWEAITPLAAEFKDSKDISRASLLAVVIVGVLYVSLAIATVGTHAYGPSLAAETPLVHMAAGTFGPSAAFVVGAAGFVLSFAPVNAYTAGMSRLVCALGRRRQLPAWLGVASASGTPRRALAAMGIPCALAAVVVYTRGWGIADLLPLSTSSFIATYVLSMAAAVRLLRPPLRYAAVVSLAACTVILFFVGPLLAWLAGIAACSLAYQRLVTFRNAHVAGAAT